MSPVGRLLDALLEGLTFRRTPQGPLLLCAVQVRSVGLLVGPSTLEASLGLVEAGAVTRLDSGGGVRLYEVAGHSASYLVELGRGSCNCALFIRAVVLEERQPICSHLLAVKLGEQLNLLNIRPSVPLQEFLRLVMP